ncbi:MAG: hypothetical protein RL077_3956 [Verrucomicrobiota bacterium]
MLGAVREHLAKRRLAEQDQLRETASFYGSIPPFQRSVQISTSGQQGHRLDANRTQEAKKCRVNVGQRSDKGLTLVLNYKLNGGPDRDQTDDLVVANDALYQLSYWPNRPKGIGKSSHASKHQF